MMNKTGRALAVGVILAIAGTTALASVWQPQATPAATAADAKKVDAGYTRVSENDEGTLALEIAAKTFVPADGKPGPKVRLVGAVHIADKSYYQSLQEMLDKSDLVLFEGVKPPGAGAFDATLDQAGKIKATQSRVKFLLSVVEDERSRNGKLPESLTEAVEDAGKRWKTMIASSLTDAWGHAVVYSVATNEEGRQRAVITSLGPDGESQDGKGDDVRVEGKSASKKKGEKDPGLQAKMADALGLTFQLEGMDSSKPNWRSSDMSIDQLQARFAETGADGDQLLKMLDGSSFMGQLASLALGLIKSSPSLAATVKLTMVDMLGSDDAIGGAAMPAGMKKMMAVILKDRNDVVLKDLRGVIDTEQHKDVSIFYGAGHLQDMEAKLRKDFGYVLEDERWLQAMSVTAKEAGMTPEQMKKSREAKRKAAEKQAERERLKAEKAEKAKAEKDANKDAEGK